MEKIIYVSSFIAFFLHIFIGDRTRSASELVASLAKYFFLSFFGLTFVLACVKLLSLVMNIAVVLHSLI